MLKRADTLLLTLSRSMRSQLNEAVQERRRFYGEFGKTRHVQTVLDRVNVAKEGARQMRAYGEGRIVEFKTNLKAQGIGRRERGRVLDIDDKQVRLVMQDGRIQRFEPGRLTQNLQYDKVSISSMSAAHVAHWTLTFVQLFVCLYQGIQP